MNNNWTQNERETVSENVLAGAVGAFLFALAGGVLWFVIYLLGFLAGISGLVGAICAVKGYSVFAKKESTKGIVIAVVMALLVIVLAWYFCLAYDVYQAHKAWYEEGLIDYTLTFFESVQFSHYYLTDPEVAPAYFGDLAIGLIFCIAGAGSYVVNRVKNAKAKAAQAAPQTSLPGDDNQDF